MTRVPSVLLSLLVLAGAALPRTAPAQEVLPFPPEPSAATAGVSIKDSVHRKRPEPRHLGAGAPNVLVILIDDVGPGTPSTYGGEIRTPTLDRVAGAGVSYNRFHSTAMCSPTRAALLTGRNHTRVGNGVVAEMANGWDGFSGVIPKSSATVAEVLRNYGYNTGAWGKWHNTPASQITSKGPFDHWPTGYGFEYFYGFLAGEASQYEPNLVRNTTTVHPPRTSGGNQHYHLTEDLADDAIQWLREQQAYAADKPFFMYWAPGAAHGPHHIMKEWADRYKGRFDDGWDKYRERVFARQKKLGFVPAGAQLTPRPDTLPAWDAIPEDEKAFQRRLMEVWAGFTEHADHNAGRVIDEIARQGRLENTLVFYIWGDNGSSAEGQNGTISEMLAMNGIATQVKQHIAALEELGGLDALGTPKTDNMFHAGWAWAGSTPFRSTKLVGAHFGGTRQPMAVMWPRSFKADKAMRSQFHHVVDVAPTIYEAAGITPPREVNGIPQDSIDGVSMAYTFRDARAPGRRTTQFFDIMGSRGIYHDGWFASAFGPRTPWIAGLPKSMFTWDPSKDTWELYNLDEDFTQAVDLAASNPAKLEEMKSLFLVEAARNKDLPIGGGLWSSVFHPEDMPATPSTRWVFEGPITRTPETSAPRIGTRSHTVEMEVEAPADANGVLFSLGGFAGGLALYVKDGVLSYEYNLFEITRTRFKAAGRLPAGKLRIEMTSTLKAATRGAPMDVQVKVNGRSMLRGTVPATAVWFTANDCLDLGSDLGSPVSTEYYDEAPFAFNGRLGRTVIEYTN